MILYTTELLDTMTYHRPHEIILRTTGYVMVTVTWYKLPWPPPTLVLRPQPTKKIWVWLCIRSALVALQAKANSHLKVIAPLPSSFNCCFLLSDFLSVLLFVLLMVEDRLGASWPRWASPSLVISGASSAWERYKVCMGVEQGWGSSWLWLVLSSDPIYASL